MREIAVSKKAASFTESVIRDMTRLAIKHNAINLAQGFPDFAAPSELKEAAKRAIDADINQYAITWGAKPFRDAIAGKFERTYGMTVDPETQICVTCGSTEAMMSAALAIIDPGDEVVVFEPFYENYGPDAILSGATPRYVTLHEPDWTFDEAELAAAFNERTRAIIINTPNNPTGKVFTRAELESIAALCQKWGVIAITDEIYEFMTYEGTEHIPLITVPGMEDRTILINAMSKTYSVTGWRVGWLIASPLLTGGIRKVHDFLTVGAAAPLQEAGALALQLPDEYYISLRDGYLERRDLMLGILEGAGFKTYKPYGA
ncbi:MAG TPA: aminotransferase class I/II-fold pyridoxal phosphate-dependent enzyme, partial [Actinomycetota bacterium]|nr:aminotransferase class I/II-fold pyridoxal phosphate-dependent enzyme [Actinomycetota bacterium]